MDVLQHDDGVVHHEPDGQHEGKQGDQVHGETECRQGDEGRDEAHRDRDNRYRHGPDRAQEHEDDQAHQHGRDGDGAVDRVDRRADEHRVV